jgi:inner membrane transporter RhtA
VYFVISAVFHYLGPSFAVLLFARVPVLGVAWLRIASAAIVFAIWRQPWRALREPLVIVWGVTLAAMNCCFYEAIHRLPLGTVAAIEFLPVIALAALGARSARNGVALLLAVGGVALLRVTCSSPVSRSGSRSLWPTPDCSRCTSSWPTGPPGAQT